MTRTERINAARLATRIMSLEIAIEDTESLIVGFRRILADDEQDIFHYQAAIDLEAYGERLANLTSELKNLRSTTAG